MNSVPSVVFEPWVPWSRRGKLAHEWEITATFDFAGLYMLARFSAPAEVPKGAASPEQSEVIYIGTSIRLTGRTEYHPKARRYAEQYNDPACACLYLALCEFGHGWFSDDFRYGTNAKAKVAYLSFAERDLIWRHTRVHGSMPALNLR